MCNATAGGAALKVWPQQAFHGSHRHLVAAEGWVEDGLVLKTVVE